MNLKVQQSPKLVQPSIAVVLGNNSYAIFRDYLDLARLRFLEWVERHCGPRPEGTRR